MAIFANNTNGASSTTRRPVRPMAQTPVNTDRQQAKVWLNVGVYVDGKFINLPVGIAIDTMAYIDLKGRNQDWIDTNDARNALLEALKIKGDSLQPGQTEDVQGLVLQLRRVDEAVEPSHAGPSRKQFVSDLVSLLSGAAVSDDGIVQDIPQAAE